MGFIHPTAIVEEGVLIGPNSRVWHHSHLRSGASIGAGCNLGKNVYIDSDVTIGDRVKIQNNVSVFNGVTIGDDVFVGPSAVFTNDKVPRAFRTDWRVVPTRVAAGASIGANATIVCGNDLGEYAMVAAGAVVTRPVRPHQLVLGNPARFYAWVCACGAVVSRNPDFAGPPVCCDCGRREAIRPFAGTPTAPEENTKP